MSVVVVVVVVVAVIIIAAMSNIIHGPKELICRVRVKELVCWTKELVLSYLSLSWMGLMELMVMLNFMTLNCLGMWVGVLTAWTLDSMFEIQFGLVV